MIVAETWASPNIARRRGRAPRGECLRVGAPHGIGKTTTSVTGLIDRDAFETSVGKVLVPATNPGDVLMDNVSSHKGPRVVPEP